MEKVEELTMEKVKKVVEDELKVYDVSPTTKLMRYMDFAKFISLIENNALYFTRADKFEDPLEGVVPKSYVNKRFPYIFPKSFKTNYIDEINNLKHNTFISCWNEAENESYALWQIYAKNYGVAIQTTKQKLDNLLTGTNAKVYKVRYTDSTEDNVIVPSVEESPSISLLKNFFVLKKTHYSYENEVRAILFDESGNDSVIKIKNIPLFIDKIYVSPFSEKWFYKLVKKIVHEKYGLDIEVEQSGIKI